MPHGLTSTTTTVAAKERERIEKKVKALSWGYLLPTWRALYSKERCRQKRLGRWSHTTLSRVSIYSAIFPVVPNTWKPIR